MLFLMLFLEATLLASCKPGNALAEWLTWLEYHLVHQMVEGLIPG